MAVKAFATVDGYHIHSNGNISFDIIIVKMDGSDDTTQETPEIDPLLGGALVNTAIKNFVKDWTDTNWGVSWGILDSVLLIAAVDLA